ncbi:MAG: asparaginase domain-containing protein [Clostridia bacterium]|jgi:L-asparaginase|nr:asparaginase domain-containing protein [Clostridia bacterium]
MNEIMVITTGGTLDSHYDVHKCTTVPYEKSEVPKYLGSFNYDFNYKQVCAKNSEDIDDNDINEIVKLIESSFQKNFIIVHGTVALKTTANILKSKIKRTGVTVVLVGSYYPLEYNCYESDALFNLGVSVSSSILLGEGVYFTIKGRTYEYNDNIKIH